MKAYKRLRLLPSVLFFGGLGFGCAPPGLPGTMSAEEVSYQISGVSAEHCSNQSCRDITLDISVRNNRPYDVCIPEFYLNESVGRYIRVSRESSGHFYLSHRGLPLPGMLDPDPMVRERALRQLPNIRLAQNETIERSIEIVADNPVSNGINHLALTVEYFACDRRESLDATTLEKSVTF